MPQCPSCDLPQKGNLLRRGERAARTLAGRQGAVDDVMCRRPGPTLARVFVAIDGVALRLRLLATSDGPHERDQVISDRGTRTGRLSSAQEFDCLLDLALGSTPAFYLKF